MALRDQVGWLSVSALLQRGRKTLVADGLAQPERADTRLPRTAFHRQPTQLSCLHRRRRDCRGRREWGRVVSLTQQRSGLSLEGKRRSPDHSIFILYYAFD